MYVPEGDVFDMAALTIPKEYEAGVANAKKLSDADTERVLRVLKEADPGASPSEIVEKLREVLPSFPKDDVDKLVEALYSLSRFRADVNVSVGEFVDDLVDAIRESANKDIHTSSRDELERLRNRFKSLLTAGPISVLAKARELRQDFANIFWDAKVITDIRPVWNGDATQPPEGVVITNTLKLEYHHVGGHAELYMYLNKEDIETLIYVLVRAQDKMATLRTLATAQWMKILEG